MNSTYYLAIDRIPLATAKTLETLGPLVLSIFLSRRKLSIAWAVIAAAGVAMLGGFATSAPLDGLGVGAALAAAVLWALYIVLAQRIGAAFSGLDGFALGMTIGAVAVAPFAFVQQHHGFDMPRVLLGGVGLAVLSSLIPYGLDILALRRLPTALYSVMLAASPVASAISGAIVLQQGLTLQTAAGILLVITASIGAVITSSRIVTA